MRSAPPSAPASPGSDLLTGMVKTKVQDAYSMRSTPQVIGAAHDAVAFAQSQVEIELNGVGDNPIFVPEDEADPDGRQLPGHAGMPAHGDGRPAITMVWVLSERRLNRLDEPRPEHGAARLPHAGRRASTAG